MTDLIVVGAGPAGIVAATVAARAGARVRLLDRARFPRDKLCGDTVNPGALALLRRLKMADRLELGGLPVDGMMVTGDDGVTVEARYPGGLCGRAMVRRELDWSLLQEALAAGVEFSPRTPVKRTLSGEGPQPTVAGVVIDGGGSEQTLRSKAVIAADGRHSTLTFGLGLARHPKRPRRWAVGAYFENVAGLSSLGEMHIRRGRYIGVAPVPGDLANVCLVKPWASPAGEFRDPEALLRRELARDSRLADRFAGARLVGPPVVLGPLAVDVNDRGINGLLLAGDAAGFIDPMTGDGIRFAVRGGELAALAALDAFQHGWSGVHNRLDRQRQHEFAGKWRFNRALRTIVALPAAVRLGGAVASLAPMTLRAVVRHAGDCQLAGLGA
jgi:flavin-dependent dehydrogenase